MPSPFFAALALDASAAVDEVMAEAWLLKPLVKLDPTDNAVPDSSRAQTVFMATYADPEAKNVEPNSYDRRQVRRPGIESGNPRLFVSPAAIAAQSLVVVQGDLLVRQADGVTWRVDSTFAMAGGSLKLALNLVG